MIDFEKSSVFKLSPIDPRDISGDVGPLLVPGERLVSAFKGVRDFVVFTDKRLITVNVQGMTGKKRDFTSLPYAKVQAFSIETAGTFDLDAELELWFSGLGKVRLEFRGKADIRALGQLIAMCAL
ncbi:PH domain-containing protein [Actinokineospora sp. G85]|uniref:PH domain-containing protein n=1 Tax=Actinokineospora sp. G85 TaxID=3406626 RepID=UPI003C75BA99